MSILNNLINGISLGSVYAIIALGYTMVYGIAKMLNFAHGDVIMVGAYICFFTMSGLSGSFEEGSLAGAVVPALAGVLLAMVVCTVLGMVIERLAYKPLRQAPSLAVLITAIGVSYFLQNSALLLWTSNPKSFSSVVGTGSIKLLGGILLGIIEIFAKAFNTNISDAVVFAVLIVVLLVKPSGLLGKYVPEKV